MGVETEAPRETEVSKLAGKPDDKNRLGLGAHKSRTVLPQTLKAVLSKLHLEKLFFQILIQKS